MRRTLAEGVVIVGSILLAFGIQAWWDGRNEAERREALLLGLSSDFALAQVDLDRVIGVHERAATAAARLTNLARADTPREDQAATVDSLVSELFEQPTLDVPRGTLEALLSSGELEVLQNVELARELTSWSALVDNLREDERTVQSLVTSDLHPFVRKSGFSTADFVWHENGSVVPWEPRRTRIYRLVADPELESIVSELWWGHWQASQSAGPVMDALQRIRRLIEGELSPR